MPISQNRHHYHFKPVHILLMALVPAMAVAGFLIMYALVHEFSLDSGANFGAALLMLLLIVIGLGVPYMMLKLGVHEAGKVRDQNEKELNIKDIPKHQDELWKDEK